MTQCSTVYSQCQPLGFRAYIASLARGRPLPHIPRHDPWSVIASRRRCSLVLGDPSDGFTSGLGGQRDQVDFDAGAQWKGGHADRGAGRLDMPQVFGIDLVHFGKGGEVDQVDGRLDNLIQ